MVFVCTHHIVTIELSKTAVFWWLQAPPVIPESRVRAARQTAAAVNLMHSEMLKSFPARPSAMQITSAMPMSTTRQISTVKFTTNPAKSSPKEVVHLTSVVSSKVLHASMNA